MYVVTGATGNIGSKITVNLLSRGKPVRIIGRSEEKLKNISDNQAETTAGDMADTEFLTKAFTGAEAVFAMIPPNMNAPDARAYENEMANSIVTAIKNSGVKKVIALSSIGAHRSDGVGIVGGLHDFEQKLRALDDVDVVFLRAGYFMENTFMSLEMIKQNNMVALPIEPDVAIPMIATQDIARAATDLMLNPDFEGKKVHYLLGERDVTYPEVVTAIKKELDIDDLNYVRSSYDDLRNAFMGMGVSESVTDEFVGLIEGMNEGRVMEDAERTPETTTDTSIEDFAKVFASVYNS